ncbi:hypothetical protein ACO2Q3_17075 [Caulobacter sp. KR2-114]|uniref:hypothetical protein n=1 Tax=Caulobacter sp. KR2-114 TaxID=3400912 RepID=UPI003C0DB2D3
MLALVAAVLLIAPPAIAGGACGVVGATADVHCSAPHPAAGQAFEGVVLHVVDGATFCLAQGPTPDRWIRVRLSGGETGGRRALMAAAFARSLVCVASRDAGQAVEATCFVSGSNLTALSRDPAVLAQAADWR